MAKVIKIKAKVASKTARPAQQETANVMPASLMAEMQKMMGEMMKKDMMDTSMYLMNNAVIEDGKMYTPVTHTYIGWYDRASMLGWCDSNGYRKLIEEVGQLKAERSDDTDSDFELHIELPDDCELDDDAYPF